MPVGSLQLAVGSVQLAKTSWIVAILIYLRNTEYYSVLHYNPESDLVFATKISC